MGSFDAHGDVPRVDGELGNRARVGVGPVTAEITSQSLRRLGLETGVVVHAAFKATATRVVSSR